MVSASGMNSPGGIGPRSRVGPPQQCLEAHHGLAGQVDRRLVVHLQLLAADRVAQVAEQHQPVSAGAVMLGLEQQSPEPGLLRAVHRHVRALHELRCGVGVAGHHRDPEAGVDVEHELVDLERPVERGVDPPGETFSVEHRVQPGRQHRELVTAEPGHGVDLAHPGRAAARPPA